MKNTKNTLLALGIAGVLATGVGLVGAQATEDASATPTAVQQEVQQRGFLGFGRGRGRGGGGAPGLGGRLALGTPVAYSFYDGDPEADGSVTETLTFTYGEDSEVAFSETLAEARENAEYVVVQTGEQTRTLDLSDFDTDDFRGRGLGFLGRNLNEGSTVTATFYDGDPEAGGQTLETLSFTYGEDSAAGFAADVEAALEDATFVTVTTSPQERTVDLSAQAERGDRFGGRGPGRGFRPNN